MKIFAFAILLVLSASAAGCGAIHDFSLCVTHPTECN